MADANTVARIGGILKTTYGPLVEEQQNNTAFTRKRYGKADNSYFRAPGLQFQFPARIGGNRAGVTATLSDDALPTPGRQQEKQFIVNDRGYVGVIKMYEKDMDNATKNFQSFISHKEDEMKGITRDILKQINIDLAAGDGSGIRGTIAATVTSATQTLAVGTTYGQFGSQYLQVNDVIDIYDSTLTTSRTAGAGVTVNSITRSSGGGAATVVLSASTACTAGDVVVNNKGNVNKAYIGLYGMTHNQGVTFQGLSTTTYPQLQANRINAGGQPLTEGLLRSAQTVVNVISGEEIDEYLASPAQYDAYEALAFAQKRFMTPTLDKGFTTLKFGDKDFVKDVDVPSPIIYGLKRSTIKFGEVSPLAFSDQDGSVLKWVPGFQAYTGYMKEYGNMCYTHPNQNVCIDTLSFPSSNPAYAR